MTPTRHRSLFGTITATATAAALAFWMGTGSASPVLMQGYAAPVPASSSLDLFGGLAPNAVGDSFSTPTGQALTVNPPGVLLNDSDPEGDPLEAVLSIGPGNGSLTLLGVGAFVYDPTSGFTGTDTFQYVASDGLSVSSAVTVTVTVGGVGPTPTTAPPTTAPPTTAPPTTAPPVTTVPTPTTTPAGGGIDGAALYAASCAGCHGASGEGGFGPALVGAGLSANQIITVTSSGAGVMPGFASSLSGPEIQAITDFLLGNPSGGGTPPPTTVPSGGGGTPPPTTVPTVSGPAAVYGAFCASCHGADGSGTVAGPDIVGEGVGEIVSTVRTGDGTMPGFPVAAISDADLVGLADYVAGGLVAGGDGSDSHHDDDHSDHDDADDHSAVVRDDDSDHD